MRLTYADTTHRYHLDGKAVKSASAVAKIAADDYALTLWQQRMVAVGMTVRPDLAERVAVDITNREAINAVVEAAHDAARTDAAANRGTQRHRVLELTLLDRADQFVTDQQRADAEVLRRTLDRYSLEPMPDRVEQFVVWPQVPVVGRYDCILMYAGAPAMFDLKSGRSAVDYPHSTVTQLALYAYAPKTSKTVAHKGDNWVCEDWGTMPDGMDLETGYVILVGDDDEVGTLYALDLRHGYRAATAAMEIVTWRREHNYGRALAREIAPPVVAVAAGGASMPDDRREALRERYRGLCDDDQARFRALGVDGDDLDAVERALDEVDPFMIHVDPVPATPIVLTVVPDPPDEGPDDVTAAEYGALKVRFDSLGPGEQMWIQALVFGGHFSIQQRPSRRRFHLYVALLTLAENGYADPDHDDHVRSLVWEASGRDDAVLFANVTTGAGLGSLDAGRAQALTTLVLGLVLGTLHYLTDPETKRLQLVGGVNTIRYHLGDIRDIQTAMPDNSVDLIVTSPPFLALRSYLPADHPDKHREIGSEPTPAEFLDTLLELTAVWRRLLTPTGSICVELGDTYSGSTNDGGPQGPGISGDGGARWRDRLTADLNDQIRRGPGWPLAKSLCGIPTLYTWSLAYGRNLLTGRPSPAGQWRIRNLIVWHRPNPPVGALGDKVRPSTSYVTTACISDRRWFDLDAERSEHRPCGGIATIESRERDRQGRGSLSPRPYQPDPAGAPPLDCWQLPEDEVITWTKSPYDSHTPKISGNTSAETCVTDAGPSSATSTYTTVGIANATTDNAPFPDVWTIPTQPYAGAHYATYPLALPRRLINLMCPRQVCRACGEARRRLTSIEYVEAPDRPLRDDDARRYGSIDGKRHNDHRATGHTTLGWSDCGHDDHRPGRVLDPFAGTGTTALAAALLGRDATCIDIDPRNIGLARHRIGDQVAILGETSDGPVTTWTVEPGLPGVKGEAEGQLNLFSETATAKETA